MVKQMTTGSFRLMKSLNRSLILNIIRRNGPISRAEIAKRTKLTPPTVSNLVKELIETEIVVESNLGKSSGGRKPTLLVINAEKFYVIGLDVGPVYTRTVLTDLNARIVAERKTRITQILNNDGLLDLLKTEIKTIIKKVNNNDANKIIGIGVGMHGIVDVEKGISLYAPNLQLRDVPIKEDLEQAFGMVVKVENDVRAMALGEAWFGSGQDVQSFVCVNVGRGVGAGVIIDGQLFHGSQFLAGEIGHMTIDLDGPRCSCGNYGCLQALTSGPSIVEKTKKSLALGEDSLINKMVDNDLDAIEGQMIFRAAEQGDGLAEKIFKETGNYLGIGITNLVHTMNPDKIIIGGGVANAGEHIFSPIRQTLEQRGLTKQAKETTIIPSMLNDHATAKGAVALLLVELFSTKDSVPNS